MSGDVNSSEVVVSVDANGSEAVVVTSGDETCSESELSLLSSSSSSSGQSSSAETFVCLPLGPFTHVV